MIVVLHILEIYGLIILGAVVLSFVWALAEEMIATLGKIFR